jgi:glycosyltransferase involved in cell wall biosynthesis
LKNLKIAYLSSINPLNKKVWSGTHYSIYKTLQKHVGEVVILGPFEPKFQILIGKLITGIAQKLFNKRYNYRHSHFVSKAYGNYFTKQLQQHQVDVIVAPAGICEMAYVKTDVPIVYISDTTMELSINYHKALSGLFKFSENETRNLEKKALEKSAKIIVSSIWAIHSLETHYKLPKEKLELLPFGANMEKLPELIEVNETDITKQVKLLFIGVYWENKGGNIAYNCLIELLKQGINAHLTVVGCIPPEEFKHPNMHVIPFIDKNTTEGLNKLFAIFSNHDLLILPTRFDCTPIVICEASAFGMPAIVANTGGVGGHLKENKNGFLIDFNDTGIGYATKIKEIISDPEKFIELRKTSRKEFEKELNWDTYGENLKEIIQSIII